MLKVIKGGVQSVVEDWPGRVGYLDNGMASSGAFDPVALGLANICVGNAPGEAGIEIAGGYLEGQFADEAVFALAGTEMGATVNGEPVPLYESFKVSKGDQIKFSHFGDGGFRCYMALQAASTCPSTSGASPPASSAATVGSTGVPSRRVTRSRSAPPRPTSTASPVAGSRATSVPSSSASSSCVPCPARTPRRTMSLKRGWSTSSAMCSRRS